VRPLRHVRTEPASGRAAAELVAVTDVPAAQGSAVLCAGAAGADFAPGPAATLAARSIPAAGTAARPRRPASRMPTRPRGSTSGPAARARGSSSRASACA